MATHYLDLDDTVKMLTPGDTVFSEARKSLADTVTATDIFTYLRNILRLAQRIFTLRLRK